MIGHQSLYLSKGQLQALAERSRTDVDLTALDDQQYADRFFELFLYSKNVQSVDYSDYEGCNIVHDMNTPINASYDEGFDVVVDGGSLEHIFNVPVALENYMRMVKKGGSLFIFTMANNHMGHGFYQFSPEFFYRIFQPENGFAIQEVILEKHPFAGAELSSMTTCYSVVDPASVRSRVGLISNSPVMIMIHAVRSEIKPIFHEFPMQSDYISQYASADSAGDGVVKRKGGIRGLLRAIYWRMPLSFHYFCTGIRQMYSFSFLNSRYYQRWKPF